MLLIQSQSNTVKNIGGGDLPQLPIYTLKIGTKKDGMMV